ncbi:hypothetical protein GRAN_2287 [Granulicella sibirica]|uniref:Uncharacterized protein n=1 Tax=Granulicella sibirica TaxID=2479048 RepID=A0A4Q0T6C7_9BACT|nr:hypothetical protein GRAN_2287 [Granulicella sibirica]
MLRPSGFNTRLISFSVSIFSPAVAIVSNGHMERTKSNCPSLKA